MIPEEKPPHDKKRAISQFYSKVIESGEQDEFKQLAQQWVEWCRQNELSSRTIFDYSDKLARLYWWWTQPTGYGLKLGIHPRNITVDKLREFVVYLRTPMNLRWGSSQKVKMLSYYTVEDYGRVLKAFFNWLQRREHIEKNPFASKDVRFYIPSRMKTTVIKNISKEQLDTIFAALKNPVQLKTFAGVRDLAMLSLLLDSGIRQGELLSMRLGDLDLKNNRCTVRGKTGVRYAFFGDECKPLINKYLKACDKEFVVRPEGLWLTVEGSRMEENAWCSMIRRLHRRSGIKFGVHGLRHSFATHMADKISPFQLQRLLGHSSIATTMIYVHNSPEILSKVQRENSPFAAIKKPRKKEKE